MIKKVISLLVLFVCFKCVQARENGLPAESEMQLQHLGAYSYSAHGAYFCPSDHATYVPTFPYVYAPQENSFPSEQQPVVSYLPGPPRITYMHFYNGCYEESIHSLKSHCEFVSPYDFAAFQDNQEAFLRLKIGYGAYDTTSKIASQIKNLEKEVIGDTYFHQIKNIIREILALTQVENCLWNEYAVHNGYIGFAPILGKEWCNALHSYQHMLANKLGGFHLTKTKKRKTAFLRREIRKIWYKYKENSLALEALNNDAIKRIEDYMGSSSVFVGDPIIRHELEYRKRYQRYKYWMISAQG